MRSLILVVALVHAALGGVTHLNPAGVTYVDGPAPAGLAAGPAYGYAAAPAPAYGYAAAPAVAAAPAYGYAAAPAVAAAPAYGYAAAPALSYAAAPAAVGYAHAQVPAAVGYAHAQVPAVAAVPTVHHVPGEAHVPVTRIEAQPGVVSKVVDVAHPAVSTRRFEVRRPAIQKQFYDIEERVVIRPAGSALVELDQPLSKSQRGPAVINPVGAVGAYAAGPIAHAPIAHAPIAHAPIAVTPSPIAVTPTPIAVTPAPFYPGPSGPAPGAPAQFESDGDSFVVENPELARAAPQPAPRDEAQARAYAPSPAPAPAPAPAVEVRTNGAALAAPAPAGPAVVPSLRTLDPHEDQANQQRLIQLLTERGGVAEVGFGRAGPAEGPVGDAGNVRARVLTATAAPPLAAPAGERVNTRRVVVSRPIETVQEIDVVEPVTKLHRLAVHQPTVFKTLRQDIARVPTSVPVLGKALAPALAHAAVPYGIYH